MMLPEPGQPWATPQCPLLCMSPAMNPANAGSPRTPQHPRSHLRSVLSAREMAGFLTALLHAALLLPRQNRLTGTRFEHLERLNPPTSNPKARAKPQDGYCCGESPVHSATEGNLENRLFFVEKVILS